MHIFRFESFELDKDAYELRHAGEVVRLERKPMELLLLLVENRGQLVSREDILDRLYGPDVFRDVDNSINTAIRKIRQALKDRPEEPRFLFTVPGKGYRFTVPEMGDIPAPAASTNAVPLDRQSQGTQSQIVQPKRRWLWIALPVVLVISFGTSYALWMYQLDSQTQKIMLAVLPFENYSGDAQQEYFVDGMTEELIAQLGALDPQHLGVIARTSVMQYKGTKKDVGKIARELKVDYVLESSARLSDARVRITSQLIQVNDQTSLWTDNFEREHSDTLKIQSDIANSIAQKIGLKLSAQTAELLATTPAINPQAHQAYLQGLQGWEVKTPKTNERAIREFTRAISIDPNYAAAYAALARAHVLSPIYSGVEPAIAMPKAREAALRAIALDNRQAGAHSALGFVYSHYDFDWTSAEREFRLGLELNPSDGINHLFYSNSFLTPLGRHDEAIAEMQKAIAIDPFSIPFDSFLGRTYVWARRYNEALAQYQKVSGLSPNFPVNYMRLARAYEHLGKFDEAITAASTAQRLFGEDAEAVAVREATLRGALTSGDSREYWQAIIKLSETKTFSPEDFSDPYSIATIYARLGDKEKALTLLEHAYETRAIGINMIDVAFEFDNLRSEPRFQTIRKRVGLVK